MSFDPENVDRLWLYEEKDGHCCVKAEDYEKLLDLYHEAVRDRQITIAEVYGEITIK